MARQKLKRFEELHSTPNVLEDTKPGYQELKGNWNQSYFEVDQPITVEMGCGNGEYSIGLAEIHPDRNFIGVDVKGDRLWTGSRTAYLKRLDNVAFLRALIQNIEDFFAENEVDTIWLTFPDPRPKGRDIRRRLTSPRFLDTYKRILKPGGMIFFKTDSTPLFDYTLEVLEERNDIVDLEYTFDLYHSAYMDEHHGIKTRFEQKFHELGEDIKYMKFRFAP